jgi:hypothetical protein
LRTYEENSILDSGGEKDERSSMHPLFLQDARDLCFKTITFIETPRSPTKQSVLLPPPAQDREMVSNLLGRLRTLIKAANVEFVHQVTALEGLEKLIRDFWESSVSSDMISPSAIREGQTLIAEWETLIILGHSLFDPKPESSKAGMTRNQKRSEARKRRKASKHTFDSETSSTTTASSENVKDEWNPTGPNQVNDKSEHILFELATDSSINLILTPIPSDIPAESRLDPIIHPQAQSILGPYPHTTAVPGQYQWARPVSELYVQELNAISKDVCERMRRMEVVCDNVSQTAVEGYTAYNAQLMKRRICCVLQVLEDLERAADVFEQQAFSMPWIQFNP